MTKNINHKISAEQIAKAAKLQQQIGNTPLFDFSALSANPEVKIFGKLEWLQFGGSVKSRAAFQIINTAIQNGWLNENVRLLDASSGNTAIAYATIAAYLGIDVTITLPANASIERKRILQSLGAEVILTSAQELTEGSQVRAQELKDESPELYYYADQYSNEANWQAHYYNTAPEIWNQTNEKITHFVAGLGTTGTITGNGKKLKEVNPNIQIIGLQPDSPMHFLEGWKHLETAKVPAIYDDKYVDRLDEVNSDKVIPLLKRIAREYGQLLSPSAAANLQGAIKLSEEIKSGTIVTTLADDSSKYGEVYERIYPASV